MTQGRPQAGDSLSGNRLSGNRLSGNRLSGNRLSGNRGYQLARLALAALLIVLAAALLRGGLPRLRLDGPYVRDELPVAATLEAVVVLLLVVLAVRRARASTDHLLATRLREVLRSALIAAALAVPCCYLLTRAYHLPQPPARVPSAGSALPGHLRVPGSEHAAKLAGARFDLLLAAVLVAAIMGCSILLLRRHWPRRRSRLPSAGSELADDREAEVRKAVQYGWLALRELDDARGAIIACYLAMEQSLASAGAARGNAETPGELLARAAAAGLVHGTAATRLTSVFYAARFSTTELTAADRDTAEQALTEL